MGWVALQILFFIGWVTLEERRRSVGETLLVRTGPVDPRDLLSGQYLALSYEFSRTLKFRDLDREPAEGEEVWVVLRPEGPFHVPDHAESQKPFDLPPGHHAIVGRRAGWRTLFGIEKYFVPEGTETPSYRDTTVRLRVGSDGKPRIESVLVRGEKWPGLIPKH